MCLEMFEWSDIFCINLKIKSCTTADILLKNYGIVNNKYNLILS